MSDEQLEILRDQWFDELEDLHTRLRDARWNVQFWRDTVRIIKADIKNHHNNDDLWQDDESGESDQS